MTRPGVVLFDWDGDDEATVRVDLAASPVGTLALTEAEPNEDVDADMFGPRWRGIGRRPGTVALTVVLGVAIAIGICALFTPAEAQGTALSAR